MTRRCKPGVRARIVKGRNVGSIVVVVRHYFGEELQGSTWPQPLFPWVVTSLGAPLRCFSLPSMQPCPSKMTIVVDDSDLEPLNDENPGDQTQVTALVDMPAFKTFLHSALGAGVGS